uniref:Uncharacterized protein n=1 Tax=Meloidogyne enterolobii TaxID=390850 RepID=A0A6V7WP74_MELEN|nr:unnamed protein product [Meloidogyne enterolobii]
MGKNWRGRNFEYLYFVPDSCFIFDGHELVELEPNDFQLSKQLEEKWKRGIEESIPMFLTLTEFTDMETVVCEFRQDNNLYYLKLPWIPKSIEDMKIARSLFQLLFNCAFTIFEIDFTVINPQMIQLLFDEDKTNMPLQIHSQQIDLILYGNHVFDFVLNHLISNEFRFDIGCGIVYDLEKNLDVLFKIVANGGGSKFSTITCSFIDSKFYNFIIEQILEASQDFSKMVKKIKFDYMRGPRISTKRVEEAGVLILVNKHDPLIIFFISINENLSQDDVEVVIERLLINL